MIFDSYADLNHDWRSMDCLGTKNSGTLEGSPFESDHPHLLIYARNQIRALVENLKARFPVNCEEECSNSGQAKSDWFEDASCRRLGLAGASVSDLET